MALINLEPNKARQPQKPEKALISPLFHIEFIFFLFMQPGKNFKKIPFFSMIIPTLGLTKLLKLKILNPCYFNVNLDQYISDGTSIFSFSSVVV